MNASVGVQAHQKLTKVERLNCCPIFEASDNHTDLNGRMANQRRHVANLWRCGLGTTSTRRVLAVRGLPKSIECIECIECHETFVSFESWCCVHRVPMCVCAFNVLQGDPEPSLVWGLHSDTNAPGGFCQAFFGWFLVCCVLICISLRWGHPKILHQSDRVKVEK